MAFGLSAGAIAGLTMAGGAVAGAAISANASRNAARTQANAAAQASDTTLQAQREAIAFQQAQSDLARADQEPWRQAGANALTQLALGTRVGATPSAGVPVNAAGLSEPVYKWLQQQNQAFGTGQKLEGPWQQAGTTQAAGTPLGFLMQNSTAFSKPSTAFTKPNTAFTTKNTAFTTKNTAFSKPFEFEADPGYDFRLAEGMKGINNSAAARGGVLSGAALKAASKYNQNFASNEYGNAYNRYQTDNQGQYDRYMRDNTTAHNKYMEENTAQYNRYNTDNTNEYNRYQTDNAGQYNRDVTNQNNQFNRLASIAGIGQTAANQMSANALQTGQLVNNNLMTTGNQIAQNQLAAGNAAASGYVGQANAVNGAISQGFNMYQSNQLMSALGNNGGGFSGYSSPSSSWNWNALSQGPQRQ